VLLKIIALHIPLSKLAAERLIALPLSDYLEQGMSDLNYLYSRHQISLYMSEHAACTRSRAAHRELTDAYAALIAGVRRGSPVLSVQ
jgi:hypothetical protein